MSAVRKPVTWLSYRGDVRPVDMARPLGPRYLSPEKVWPVVAEYDAAADRTRVGFSFIAPEATP